MLDTLGGLLLLLNVLFAASNAYEAVVQQDLSHAFASLVCACAAWFMLACLRYRRRVRESEEGST